jgi:hypothetical protein
MAGNVALMGEKINTYMAFMGKPERNGPVRIPWGQWENDIKMDLKEIGCDDMDWINLAQNRDQWRALVNTVMNVGIL